MEVAEVERRLVAILAADVEGYSRMMGADEEGTLSTLHRCREIIDGMIAKYHGHFVGSAGDSVLAEFASAVDAVRCAYEIQQDLWALNVDFPAQRRMNFRIGVNLGDVIVEGKDIYGDGVNVAARLEGLADGGGVSVSRSVYNQVKGKVDYIFDGMGSHPVKNIAEPITVYRMRMSPDDKPHMKLSPSARAAWRGAGIAVVAVLALQAATYWVWSSYFPPRQFETAAGIPTKQTLTAAEMARLAVIPLPKNLSPGMSFQQCADCPELIVVPSGSFTMGSPDKEKGRHPTEIEGPQHKVRIPRSFATGKFEITFREWDACVKAGGCRHKPQDRGWGRGNLPVLYVSWFDVQDYLQWLTGLTGYTYRLPSEAEWEYVARAGTQTVFWWGDDIGIDKAICQGCGTRFKGNETTPVGSSSANAFGLYDVHGNVYEWTADCWNGSYAGAPTDGSAWVSGDCGLRVLRGGSWGKSPENLRSARRIKDEPSLRSGKRGFRVIVTLP